MTNFGELLDKAIAKAVMVKMENRFDQFDLLTGSGANSGTILKTARMDPKEENSVLNEWKRRNFIISTLLSDQKVFLQSMITLEQVKKSDFQRPSFMAHFIYRLVNEIRNTKAISKTSQVTLRLVFSRRKVVSKTMKNSNSGDSEKGETNKYSIDDYVYSLYELFQFVGQRLTRVMNFTWTDNIFLQHGNYEKEIFDKFEENKFKENSSQAMKDALRFGDKKFHPEIMRDLFLLLLALGKENVAHSIWLLGYDQLSTALVASAFLREMSFYANAWDRAQWSKLYAESSK